MQQQTIETTSSTLDPSKLSDKKLAAEARKHAEAVDAAELALAELRIAAADAKDRAIDDPSTDATLAELTADRMVARAERDLAALRERGQPIAREHYQREKARVIAAADDAAPKAAIATHLDDARARLDDALDAFAAATRELIAHNVRCQAAHRVGGSPRAINLDALIFGFGESHLEPLDLRAITSEFCRVATRRGGAR